MKTITTIAAALFIAFSFNASAQDTKTRSNPAPAKQEPVKQDNQTKGSSTQTQPAKSKAEPATQTGAPTKPNTLSQPVSKGKTGSAKLPAHKNKAVKRTAPAKEEAAPAKKMD